MKKYLVALAASVALVFPASASAQTAEIGYARVLGPIHADGTTARLHVRYSCDEGDHLWVSAKQSANGAVDPAIEGESSGENHVSATWLDSHRNSFVCNGRAHQGWFTIDQVEPGKYGSLVNGQAWVQFCITSETVQENFGLTVSLADWVKVV